MYRTITFHAICLFLLSLVIFVSFPSRITSEQINAENTGNEEIDKSTSNVTMLVTEFKPTASELISEHVTGTVEIELPLKEVVNKTVEGKFNETVVDVKPATSTSEGNDKAVLQETNIVEHLVSTEKYKITDDILQGMTRKQARVDRLKAEIKHVKEDLLLKTKRLEEIKNRTKTSQDLVDTAEDHLKVLIFALNSLQGSIIQSSKAAFETDWQLELQKAMYNEAMRKYARLSRELEMTRNDYEKTKMAAENATAAAKTAQTNLGTIDINIPTSTFNVVNKGATLSFGSFGSNL